MERWGSSYFIRENFPNFNFQVSTGWYERVGVNGEGPLEKLTNGKLPRVSVEEAKRLGK